MATLVGASGGGFLGRARLAVTPLLGGPASGALGSALHGPQNLDATGLKSLLFRSREKTRVRGPWSAYLQMTWPSPAATRTRKKEHRPYDRKRQTK